MPFAPEPQPDAPPSPTTIYADPSVPPPWSQPPSEIPLARTEGVQEEVPIAMVIDGGGAVQAETPEPVLVEESDAEGDVPMPQQGVQNPAEAEAPHEGQAETSTENEIMAGESEGVENPVASSGDVSGEGVQNPEGPVEDTSTPMEEDHTGEETAQGKPRQDKRDN